MPYPNFPLGGAGARPMFFSTFDPGYMQGAIDVFTAPRSGAGGGAMYNMALGGVGGYPQEKFLVGEGFFYNGGNRGRTFPTMWGAWKGPRPIMWTSYAGGQVPL
jgi:hypothetical protein